MQQLLRPFLRDKFAVDQAALFKYFLNCQQALNAWATLEIMVYFRDIAECLSCFPCMLNALANWRIRKLGIIHPRPPALPAFLSVARGARRGFLSADRPFQP